MHIISSKTVPKTKWQPGYSDFKWLKEQALDQATLEIIETIEADEQAYAEERKVSHGDDLLELRLQQGTFYTTRSTGHSIAHIFVHIFKNKEHMQLQTITRTDPVIVDIGANEGFYSTYMSQQFPDAKIIAVEPNPIAYRLLKKNMEANNFENIHPLNVAVWSDSGEHLMNILPEVTSIGTLAMMETSFMQRVPQRVAKVSVATITLSDIIDKFGVSKIDLLKIDIEGGELEVLKSSREVMPSVHRLVLEYHSQQAREEIIRLMKELNFRVELHAPDRDDFGDLYFVNNND